MKETALQVLTIAYACVGIVGLIGFLPTIKDLYLYKKASANIASYVLWTGTSLTSFLYSLFILPDLLFRIASGINLGACMIVLALSIGLKNHR